MNVIDLAPTTPTAPRRVRPGRRRGAVAALSAAVALVSLLPVPALAAPAPPHPAPGPAAARAAVLPNPTSRACGACCARR